MDVHDFLHDYQWVGTAYEKGIDDQTKIKRLSEEIEDLKQQLAELQRENEELMNKLDILPF